MGHKLKYREDVVVGLENAPEAFIGLFKGRNLGQLLVEGLADLPASDHGGPLPLQRNAPKDIGPDHPSWVDRAVACLRGSALPSKSPTKRR